MLLLFLFFFFKQKTAYEMRISDWSSDVCSSDLVGMRVDRRGVGVEEAAERIGGVELLQGLAEVGVALVERLADTVGVLAGQLQAQPVVAHRLLQQLTHLSIISRPRRILAVVVPAGVAAEVEDVLVQQPGTEVHPPR